MNALNLAIKINKRIGKRFRENTKFQYNYLYTGRAYTTDFFNELENILTTQHVSHYEKGYAAEKQYFQKEKVTIDYIIWKSFFDKSQMFVNHEKFKGNFWHYDVLIEHENDGKSWLHELQKLCSVNAPNKLIITYGRDKNTDECKGIKILPFANIIVQDTLSDADKYIVSQLTEKPELLGKLPELVVMFGAETKSLSHGILPEAEMLYDIYSYNYQDQCFKKVL